MRRRMAAIGSAVFFLVGPGTFLGLVPWWLTAWRVREPLPYWLPLRVVGLMLLIAALVVLVEAFVRFVMEGFGTPVPVAAPDRLVVGGLYRYVRNPMYVALLAGMVGQALLLGQLRLLLSPRPGGSSPPHSSAGVKNPSCFVGSARTTRPTGARFRLGGLAFARAIRASSDRPQPGVRCAGAGTHRGPNSPDGPNHPRAADRERASAA
jgi:hypothetical protein